MLFNSLEYLIFFPVTAAVYFFLPAPRRWMWLLVASLFFYAWYIPSYLVVLLIVISVDFVAARAIEAEDKRVKKLALIISVVSTCALLFVFKYFDLATSTVLAIAELLHWNYSPAILGLLVPLGLSFHTLRSLSYVIEVYRRQIKAERNFAMFALYVMFFPQLVAGPITRPHKLLPQLHSLPGFDYGRVATGLRRMVWGLFKKLVIADRLAVVVNTVYGSPGDFGGPVLSVATIFFAIQIYADFSGYTDLALGSAEVFGVRLQENFHRPYGAESISEFWRRWHISLSTWFRDYVYIPFGGNRSSFFRRAVNVLIVFFLSGLWHGANWTFVVWGLVHASFMIISRVTTEARDKVSSLIGLHSLPRLRRTFRVATTFVLVSLAWVFFRAPTLSDAFIIFRRLGFNWRGSAWSNVTEQLSRIGLSQLELLLLSAATVVVVLVHILAPAKGYVTDWLASAPGWARWSFYYILILSLFALGNYGGNEFIYFKF